MFSVAFFENFLFKQINKLDNRNFHSSILFFISSFILFILYNLLFKYNSTDFYFLYDWKFYLLIILELSVFYLYRENYYQNKTNYTIVNMFVFSTIYLMPILAFFYNFIFEFNTTLNIKYDTFLEAFIFSFTLFILSLIYYINKIKNKEVNNLKLLIILLIVLLNTMYFSVKMVQTYNGYLIYSFIHLSIAFYFLNFSKKELKTISYKRVGFYSLFPFIYVFYFSAAALVSVEFITIFKRVSQIISAMILDKKVIRKDAILIFLILLTSLIFYIYKV